MRFVRRRSTPGPGMPMPQDPSIIHHLPIVTTLVAAGFLPTLLVRAIRRDWPPHLTWWAIGVACYGAGTALESIITLRGNSADLNRWWYLAGDPRRLATRDRQRLSRLAIRHRPHAHHRERRSRGDRGRRGAVLAGRHHRAPAPHPVRIGHRLDVDPGDHAPHQRLRGGLPRRRARSGARSGSADEVVSGIERSEPD